MIIDRSRGVSLLGKQGGSLRDPTPEVATRQGLRVLSINLQADWTEAIGTSTYNEVGRICDVVGAARVEVYPQAGSPGLHQSWKGGSK